MHDVPRKAWRALFAAQLGWMLDAMDFLLFTFALVSIKKELALTNQQASLPIVIALIASAIGGIA
ncbi:MAG TPA: MFS transporter, partial [Thermoanaerobaculia bacterium]|nr:MFS transporter [Thermoanaerobaculia bacterium]